MIHLVTFVPNRRLFDPAPLAFVQAMQTPPITNWWHQLRDTWLIVTPESIEVLYARLLPLILTTDRLLIVSLTERTKFQGWLSQDAWDWIRAAMAAPDNFYR